MALWRLHVQVTDQPGQLGELAAALGGAGANILSLHVIGERSDTGAVTDELLLELPAAVPVTALVAAAEGRGFRCTVVVRAGAQALVDPVTTALALARCVVLDPASASRAVAAMLGAKLVDDSVDNSVDDSVDDRDVRPAHVAEVGSVCLGRGWRLTATELFSKIRPDSVALEHRPALFLERNQHRQRQTFNDPPLFITDQGKAEKTRARRCLDASALQ